MHNYVYFIFNIIVLAPVVILSIVTDVKPQKNWRGLLLAYLFVSLPFVVWDIWAASAGHWGFNGKYILPGQLLGLPFEEILFFFTVPFAMMYVWGVINKHVTNKKIKIVWPSVFLLAIATISLVLTVVYWPNGYTRSAMLATMLSLIFIVWSGLAKSLRFWVFQMVLLAIFVVFNSILTALPVITYGENSIIGLRVGTIPLEDFWFNFALINLFLVVYNKITACDPVT